MTRRNRQIRRIGVSNRSVESRNKNKQPSESFHDASLWPSLVRYPPALQIKLPVHALTDREPFPLCSERGERRAFLPVRAKVRDKIKDEMQRRGGQLGGHGLTSNHPSRTMEPVLLSLGCGQVCLTAGFEVTGSGRVQRFSYLALTTRHSAQPSSRRQIIDY